MRSPLLGLFAALAALTPGGLFGATPPASVLLDLPTRERDRPLDHTLPREHLAPVVRLAPEPVEPPPPSVLPRGHVVWCPGCAGRGADARAACGTCGGKGKVWREIDPVRVAKMTRQLQRAALRALARRQYTAKELRKRTLWCFSRTERRGMACEMFSDDWKVYGGQLTSKEVLRVL